MYADLSPKRPNREIDDFGNFDGFLDTDIELEEFSFDLQNLISHSINGIQPTVTSDVASVQHDTPTQAFKRNAQSCDSPGILLMSGTSNAIDHSELKPSLTELQPGWFVSSHAPTVPTSTYMTKISEDSSVWHQPLNIKVENLSQGSPCQTVPQRPSFSNVPSPSFQQYSNNSTPFESEPNSPRSRNNSFSSIPTPVANADNTFLEIPRQKPGRKPSGKPNSNNRKRHVEKGTEEYVNKRCRNNIAVRKSREKAKQKQQTTEVRVQELSQENKSLQKKVELLTKELSVLRSLFVNVGATLPSNIDELLKH